MASPKLISESEICEASRTIAMLIKLLPTRMDARSCSGSESNFKICWAERFLFVLSNSISFGSREKSATSEPETRAERPNRTINTRSPERALIVKGKKSMFPNKAPTDVTKFVSKLSSLVIRMEDHQGYFLVLNSLMQPEVHAQQPSSFQKQVVRKCCCFRLSDPTALLRQHRFHRQFF